MIKWLLTTALVGVLLGIIAVAGIFWFYGQGLPNIEDYQPKQVTRVYSADEGCFESTTTSVRRASSPRRRPRS